jgi:hypothetical protein
LTTRSLSQYTHFIALNPNLQKHYSNHGLAGQCRSLSITPVLSLRYWQSQQPHCHHSSLEYWDYFYPQIPNAIFPIFLNRMFSPHRQAF